jgi:ADP-ribosylglycohydrolase
MMADGFGYDCEASLEQFQREWRFDETCQGTVPVAIGVFLHATDYEDTIRSAVALGGDTDTLACIAGSVAEAFYGGVPAAIRDEALRRLDDTLRDEVVAFASAYKIPQL